MAGWNPPPAAPRVRKLFRHQALTPPRLTAVIVGVLAAGYSRLPAQRSTDRTARGAHASHRLRNRAPRLRFRIAGDFLHHGRNVVHAAAGVPGRRLPDPLDG